MKTTFDEIPKPIFTVSEKDVLNALDMLGDAYPIAHMLAWGDIEDACACVEARLEGTIAEELDDILQIFLENLEAQKRKDHRRLW